MKYKALVIVGVGLILLGYGLMESGGRVKRVFCERTENSFLPVCHVTEYFLGLFPSQPTETVGEITALSQRGKDKKEFFLVQRLPNKKMAPVELNKARLAGRPADQEPVASLNRLAEFFRNQEHDSVEVHLTNEAGNVPLGIFLFVLGVALVLHQRIRHERRKPKQTFKA